MLVINNEMVTIATGGGTRGRTRRGRNRLKKINRNKFKVISNKIFKSYQAYLNVMNENLGFQSIVCVFKKV